ncbi:methylase [Mycobacterium sp. 852002-51163_SCH5372311]|uniref:HemK2/MTQ2 family protein methyltransferase n=1 Tax=Mycobacterium sp. 852002-51163_SCH5372311 TaxID=1834097 RepID=UPI0007FBECF7|nr:HemK2/MTQ2 family protein methyltransferase [Mycobacterium sp. 852002-51163_SCH5372311]OBF86720.1 methylase [Mycobacterium sp. 852002-51163_SCH5372311]
MTTTYQVADAALPAVSVYQPQYDSRLLVDTMKWTGIVEGRRVLDLCTGSGFVAIAAAEMGCASVTAFDICPHAVRCSRDNAVHAGVDVDVREGSWTRAFDCAQFDVVLSNPPYVPTPPIDDADLIAPSAGPSWAFNAGPDGRLVLDPLCESATKLLCHGGSLLLVQSAFAGVQQSLDCLRSTGLHARVVASQWVPFGPVLSARARWLEDTGQLRRGCRKEELVVIRAEKP